MTTRLWLILLVLARWGRHPLRRLCAPPWLVVRLLYRLALRLLCWLRPAPAAPTPPLRRPATAVPYRLYAQTCCLLA